ncbi:hypothetical protein B0H13DRAFT_2563786 [Mycena leptocephala]|nr:hypothetical protein B0H13DRAFT_2563786 [Mycena leptocephala]
MHHETIHHRKSLNHPRRCRSGSAGEEESRQARQLRMTLVSVRVATARTSIIGAADTEARSRTPHMTADTTQGDHVYGNETDCPEVTGRARGVRWSGDERESAPVDSRAASREQGPPYNDTDFPRTTQRARGLKSNHFGPKDGSELGAQRIAPDRAGAGGRRTWSSRLHSRGRDDDVERGGMHLRSRRARAIDDVSDAGGCVVREDGVRMRMYVACVHVGCMGAAWKTENQLRQEDARGPRRMIRVGVCAGGGSVLGVRDAGSAGGWGGREVGAHADGRSAAARCRAGVETLMLPWTTRADVPHFVALSGPTVFQRSWGLCAQGGPSHLDTPMSGSALLLRVQDHRERILADGYCGLYARDCAAYTQSM